MPTRGHTGTGLCSKIKLFKSDDERSAHYDLFRLGGSRQMQSAEVRICTKEEARVAESPAATARSRKQLYWQFESYSSVMMGQ